MNAIRQFVRGATREHVEKLQAALAKLPQATIETRHYFADGMYCREVVRPRDTLIVGKVHKREHFYIVLSGEVTVTGDGGPPQRIKAPRIIVSQPGTKRAVYAHEDSICITVHRTDLKDIELIEKEIVEDDPTALFDAYNNVKRPALEST